MNDEAILGACFELESFRTDTDEGTRTLYAVEQLEERDMYAIAHYTDDEVSIEWLESASFIGAEFDYDDLRIALLRAGVPEPLTEEQFKLVQNTYTNWMESNFSNILCDAEGVYIGEEFVYSFIDDDDAADYFREKIEQEFRRYESRLDSRFSDPPDYTYEALTDQQLAHIGAAFEALPRPPSVPDDKPNPNFVCRLEGEELSSYKKRALELMRCGIFIERPYEAKAQALQEENKTKEDIAQELPSNIDVDVILHNSTALVERAKWTVSSIE